MHIEESIMNIRSDRSLRISLSVVLLGVVLSVCMTASAEPKSMVIPQPQLELAAYYAPDSVRSISVSNDGKYLAYLKLIEVQGDNTVPLEESIQYALVVVNVDDVAGAPVYSLQPTSMQITDLAWLTSTKLVVSLMQELKPGNELHNPVAYRTHLVDVETGKIVDIPPRASITRSAQADKAIDRNRLSIITRNPEKPNTYLVSWNDVTTGSTPIYELNVDTGAIRKVARQRGALNSHKADLDGEIRLASTLKRRVASYFGKLKGSNDWELMYEENVNDKTGFRILSFHPTDPNSLLVTSYQSNDFLGVYRFDMVKKAIVEEVYTPKHGDVIRLLSTVVDNRPLPIAVVYADGGLKTEYFADIPEAREHQASMARIEKAVSEHIPDAVVQFISQSSDATIKIIRASGIDRPGAYFILRDGKQLDLIAQIKPTLNSAPRNPQTALRYKARDGLEIEGMLVRPMGQEGPGPTIIMPHGGPWARDYLFYDTWSDMFASRGYTVFRPNYRGSTGYGQKHFKAGDGQWGYTMQDDLDDGAQHLVDIGVADPDHLIMYGYSYGGYAAMAAPVRDNPPYVCAISGAGVSNLASIKKEIWKGRTQRAIQYDAVDGLSPMKAAEKASIPLLMLHGENDVIVPSHQSSGYARELRKYGKDHEVVVIPHMAHQGPTWSYGAAEIYYAKLFDFLETKCNPR